VQTRISGRRSARRALRYQFVALASRRLDLACVFQAKLADSPLAEDVLANLARNGAGKPIDDLDVLWYLEM
jgi:hypothetical protein